ncbi:MAG: hypothetical protein Q9227_003017 [Pyrenula ochraceoflavens]
MDPGLNSLLKWSVENSEASRDANVSASSSSKPRGLDEQALKVLMGGPSDADLMRQAMTVIQNPESSHEAKMTAFDNFEQLIETIDNANNMEALALWTPLVEQLSSNEPDLRRMAAWCIGTAVQNNVKGQEKLLVLGGIPQLVDLAVKDQDRSVRKKCVYALSSAIRNYQPATNEATKCLPEEYGGGSQLEAGDMDAIDEIMRKLREQG